MVEGNRVRRRIKIYRVLHVESRYYQETVESKTTTRLDNSNSILKLHYIL